MKSLKEKIEVMQAALDGKEIEMEMPNGEWLPQHDLQFNWADYEYRVKSEPFECWANIYPDGEYTIYGDEKTAELYRGVDYLRTVKLVEAE